MVPKGDFPNYILKKQTLLKTEWIRSSTKSASILFYFFNISQDYKACLETSFSKLAWV